MPHLKIEYSANLEGRTDITSLCRELLAAALSTGLFEVGAVRVRAVRCDHYAIADQEPDNAFVDLQVRIGTGRSPEDKKMLGQALIAAIEQCLSPLFETGHFALSCEIREIDPDLSWRNNAIHRRLRAPAAQSAISGTIG